MPQMPEIVPGQVWFDHLHRRAFAVLGTRAGMVAIEIVQPETLKPTGKRFDVWCGAFVEDYSNIDAQERGARRMQLCQ